MSKNVAVYDGTYWAHQGLYEELNKAVCENIPSIGKVEDCEALEKYRQACNCYYDLYNNGLCNLRKEFRQIFGFKGPKYSQELTQEVAVSTEAKINELLMNAAIALLTKCKEAE